MATTDLAAQYDSAFVELFYEHLPVDITEGMNKESFMWLAQNGFLQRDRLAEFAMSSASDGLHEVVSEEGRDHTDDTDTKTVTVNHRMTGRSNVIITNISNKVGPLRVVAYNSATGNFHYYFIFDYDRVRGYNRIEFDVFSNSKYNNGECGIELSSFKELAKKKNIF
jgi:hypothetical protein